MNDPCQIIAPTRVNTVVLVTEEVALRQRSCYIK